MSNHLAIASVTETLRLILSEYGKMDVSTKSPDQAARENNGARINVFLYHTMHNATWRNMDIPTRARPVENGTPPLALNLYYLLTAYAGDSDLAGQRMLGRAMQVLHDLPILRSEDIQRATRAHRDLGSSDLDEQIEKVRIAPDTLNIEEMSRLWTTFQTQYRVSAAYQASVALIESEKPRRVAMPVLKRGADDRGVITVVGLGACLQGIEYRANRQSPNLPAADVGGTITITGTAIPGTGVTVVIRDPKQAVNPRAITDEVARLKPSSNENGERITVTLDENVAAWSAGLMTVEVQYDRDGRDFTSNSLSLAIAPKLLLNEAGNSIFVAASGDGSKRLMSVSLDYPNGLNRRVLLILNRYVEAEPGNAQADPRNVYQITQEADSNGVSDLNPSFDISEVPPGEYWVRLRVDGVDSLVLRESTEGAGLEFDPRQRVVIGRDV